MVVKKDQLFTFTEPANESEFRAKGLDQDFDITSTSHEVIEDLKKRLFPDKLTLNKIFREFFDSYRTHTGNSISQIDVNLTDPLLFMLTLTLKTASLRDLILAY